MDTLLDKALGQETAQMAATEKQHLLARLLARLAHEIRNPLSSLDIHVQLLDEDLAQSAPETREKLSGRLEIIHGELQRLENIVKQFLRLAGPSALELEQTELSRVVGHVCELLRPEAAARRIEILTDPGPVPPTLLADPVQLTQALMNLVINALQAVESNGRVTVRVSQPEGESRVDIEVHDTGPGVPAGNETTIFEPYFTTKPEGSGLGLWIAQQIAAAHGGTIRVANPPAGGAIFTLCLPLAPKELVGG